MHLNRRANFSAQFDSIFFHLFSFLFFFLWFKSQEKLYFCDNTRASNFAKSSLGGAVLLYAPFSPHRSDPKKLLFAYCWRVWTCHSHKVHPPSAKSHHLVMVAEGTLANYAGLEISTLLCAPAAEAICSGTVFSGNKAPLFPAEWDQPQVWSSR